MSTKALVRAQGQSFRWPDPALLHEVLKRGAEAVPYLCSIFSDDIDGMYYSDFAAQMLASLYVNGIGEAVEAIPALTSFFETSIDDWLDFLSRYVSAFGELVIEPLIEIINSPIVDWYQRAMATNAAIMAAGNSPTLKARVAETLRNLLARYVVKKDADDGDPNVGTLISDLADLRNEQARDLVYQAFDLGLPDLSVLSREHYDRLMQQAPSPTQTFDESWLENYERQYLNAVYDPDHDFFIDDDDDDDDEFADDENKFDDNFEPQDGTHASGMGLAELAAMVDRLKLKNRMQQSTNPGIEIAPPTLRKPATPQRALAKPGRNDPCWCGSGKKYKHCHLREDEAKTI